MVIYMYTALSTSYVINTYYYLVILLVVESLLSNQLFLVFFFTLVFKYYKIVLNVSRTSMSVL